MLFIFLVALGPTTTFFFIASPFACGSWCLWVWFVGKKERRVTSQILVVVDIILLIILIVTFTLLCITFYFRVLSIFTIAFTKSYTGFTQCEIITDWLNLLLSE